MAKRYLRFNVGALISPALTRKFTPIAVVSKFHDVIDSHASVPIVVIIGLPDATETVHGRFPIVAEIPAESLEVGTILIAAKDHALLVWFAFVIHFVASQINNGLAVLILDLTTSVAKVEVELAIGTEVYGMDAVIVLCSACMAVPIWPLSKC